MTESWAADRDVYVRDTLWLAAACMVGATLLLFLIGNDDYWIGAVGALAAIGVRNAYLASDELAGKWTLTSDSVVDRHGRIVPLAEIVKVRRLGSAVQIVTRTGDKMLLKYLADPDVAAARLRRAAGLPA